MTIPSIFNNCSRGGSQTHPYSPTIKSIALGGMTSPFLSAAMVSTEKVIEAIELVKKLEEVEVFLTRTFRMKSFSQEELRRIRNDK